MRMKWLVDWLWARYFVWRFGCIEERVVSVDGGVASEIAFTSADGTIVGYWAYGHWDPKLPYRGQGL